VKVRVTKVDTEHKRIALSMRMEAPPAPPAAPPAPRVQRPAAARPPQPRPPARPQPPPRPLATVDDLKRKFDKGGEKKLFTVKPKFNVKQFMK
jgi:transcriptional accessory protein Tex/SPT6